MAPQYVGADIYKKGLSATAGSIAQSFSDFYYLSAFLIEFG